MQPSAYRGHEVKLNPGTVNLKDLFLRGSMTRLHYDQQNNVAFRGRSGAAANLPKAARSNSVLSTETGGQAPASRNTQGSTGSYGQSFSNQGYVSPYGRSLPTPFSLAMSPGAVLWDTEQFPLMNWDHDSPQQDPMEYEDDEAGSTLDCDNTVLHPISWSQGQHDSGWLDADMFDPLPEKGSFSSQHVSFGVADAVTQSVGVGMQVDFHLSSAQEFERAVEDSDDEMNMDALPAVHPADGPSRSRVPRGPSPAPELYPPIKPRPLRLGSAQEPIEARNTLNSKLGVRKKGRDGPLPEITKAAAARVRLRGACVRCHTMKEKCDDRTPCGPCQNPQRRKYDLPCMKAWPREKACHVLSDLTIGHLTWKEFYRTFPHAELIDNRLTVPLRQDFEQVLRIPVLEFQPRNERDTYKFTFPIKEDGDKFTVEQIKILSPPLVPDVRTREKRDRFINAVHEQTKKWLREVEADDGAEWSATLFPPEYGQSWPRTVLWHVCSFYHWAMRRGCEPLKMALDTTVVMHMIGHAFYIVPEEVDEVLSQMHFQPDEQQPEGFVCPQFIDRMLKVALYPVFAKSLKKSLQLYEDLASREKHPSHLTRDRIFCVSVVLLVIAAVQQAKSVEKTSIHIEHHETKTMHRAYIKISEIEREFIDTIFDIWNYKFQIDQPMHGDVEGSERPAANRADKFNVLGRFRQIYLDHEAELAGLDISLPRNPDVKVFGAMNVTRVLKRFYLVIFQDVKSNVVKQEG